MFYSFTCRAEDESQEEFAGKSVLKQKNAESGGKIIWRVANGLMTIFFVMAVGVQVDSGIFIIEDALIVDNQYFFI